MTVGDYLDIRGEKLLELTIEHLQLVLVSLAIATAIGVVVSILTYRSQRASGVTLALAGAILTIPSFALFGLLIPIFGLGAKPAIVALSAYALLPIVRNTIVGLQEIDPAIREAARGMGIGRWRRLLRIELPIAWPVIVAGMRTSAMLIVGIAAIAAFVNGPGLGNDIFLGLARIGSTTAEYLVIGATLAIVLLALALDLVLMLFARFTTSKGIRQ